MGQTIAIGQGARMTRLSPKALRLYAESGLLVPARVDPASGYRSYRPEQVATGRRIRLLRTAGMPLAEIADFLRTPSRERLVAFGAAQANRQAEGERVLRFLLRTIDKEEEDAVSYEVGTKEVDSRPFESRTATVAIGELVPFISRAIADLSGEVEAIGPPFVIYHDPVNDEVDGRVEVCVPTAGRGAGGGELPAGSVAFTLIEGDQTEYPDILAAYDAVADWAKARGHELDGPPREIYLSPAGAPERLEIAWPIR